jgi:hypothetical protein
MACASDIITLVREVLKKKTQQNKTIQISRMKIVPSLRHSGGIRFKYWPGNWLR